MDCFDERIRISIQVESLGDTLEIVLTLPTRAHEIKAQQLGTAFHAVNHVMVETQGRTEFSPSRVVEATR